MFLVHRRALRVALTAVLLSALLWACDSGGSPPEDETEDTTAPTMSVVSERAGYGSVQLGVDLSERGRIDAYLISPDEADSTKVAHEFGTSELEKVVDVLEENVGYSPGMDATFGIVGTDEAGNSTYQRAVESIDGADWTVALRGAVSDPGGPRDIEGIVKLTDSEGDEFTQEGHRIDWEDMKAGEYTLVVKDEDGEGIGNFYDLSAPMHLSEEGIAQIYASDRHPTLDVLLEGEEITLPLPENTPLHPEDDVYNNNLELLHRLQDQGIRIPPNNRSPAYDATDEEKQNPAGDLIDQIYPMSVYFKRVAENGDPVDQEVIDAYTEAFLKFNGPNGEYKNWTVTDDPEEADWTAIFDVGRGTNFQRAQISVGSTTSFANQEQKKRTTSGAGHEATHALDKCFTIDGHLRWPGYISSVLDGTQRPVFVTNPEIEQLEIAKNLRRMLPLYTIVKDLYDEE